MSRSRWIIPAVALVAAAASCVGAGPGEGSLTEAVGSGSSTSTPDAAPPPVSTPTPDAAPPPLTWQQCAAGAGTDYTGQTGHLGSTCRGACGADCPSNACSDWSPCTNGQQFRTCWTTPFCQRHDKCYDCCHDNGMPTSPPGLTQCGTGCDANCLYQFHPPCKYPPVCTEEPIYGSGSGSGSNGAPIGFAEDCVADPRDAPNCGKQYTSEECINELPWGIMGDFPEAVTMQFTQACSPPPACVSNGQCNAPPCASGTDSCGNGCFNAEGCNLGSGSNGGSGGY
jgi:hypothetical protein